MRARKLTGIALATTAAGIFAVTVAAPAQAAQAQTMKCEGVNACKGQGACKGASNACKGQNACKGHGFMQMSQADCDKAKMGMKK
jgi:hypothetical protein